MIIIKYIAVTVLLGVYESVESNTWSGALSAEYGPENIVNKALTIYVRNIVHRGGYRN